MVKVPLILSALTLLGGCATIGTPTGRHWAGFGQDAHVGAVLIRPDALVEDSRCQAGVQCAWAGRIVVDATLALDDKRSHPRLILGKPYQFAGRSLVLDAVKPIRRSEEPIAGPDYRFHFSFGK